MKKQPNATITADGTHVPSRSIATKSTSRSTARARIHSGPGDTNDLTPPVHAAPGDSSLDARIAAFVPEPETPGKPSNLPPRLRHAIDRLRWYLCGIFGVKAANVTDAHVAAFLARLDDGELYRALPGVGVQTEDDLRAWGRKGQ